MRRALLLLAALAALLVLAGCGPNYAGNGNAFRLRATIASVGSKSVTVDAIHVEQADGKADGWFVDGGDHQIHDNYNTCGWHGRHRVGHVYAVDGHEARVADLRPGMRVLIVGRIRANAASCGKYAHMKRRPVFDTLRVLKR